jgi:hypothetical protein
MHLQIFVIDYKKLQGKMLIFSTYNYPKVLVI